MADKPVAETLVYGECGFDALALETALRSAADQRLNITALSTVSISSPDDMLACDGIHKRAQVAQR